MNSMAVLAVLGTVLLGQSETASTQTTTTVTKTESAPAASGLDALNAPRALDIIPAIRDARAALEERGIKLSLNYCLIVQTGTGGAGSYSAPNIFGRSKYYSPNHNAFRTTNNLYWGLGLDFGKLTGWEALNGLTFYGQAEMGYGLGYNRNVGALTATPNAALPGNQYDTQLVEYWFDWTKTFDNLTLRGRIGSINYGRTFGLNAYMGDYTQQFLNNLFWMNPFLANATRNGFAVGLGAEGQIEYKFSDELAVSYASGVYSTNYGYNYSQFTSAFERTGANGRISVPNPAYNGYSEAAHALWLNEIGVKTKFLDWGNGKMPGNYRFGMMYTDNPALDLGYNTYGGILPARYKSQYTAFYLSFDQMLYKEKADSDTEGLGVAFQFAGTGLDWALAPGQIPLSTYFAWAVQYTGLIPGRDKDVMGLGYAISSYNSSGAHNGVYGNGGPELSDSQVLEWYYKINVFDWLSLTPDLQYIVRPDGLQNSSDAFVVGFRATMSF